MASGANNPAFVSDNDTLSDSPIRIIHINPAEEEIKQNDVNSTENQTHLHQSKSVPSMRDDTQDFTGSTITLTHDKCESTDGLDMRPLPYTKSSTTLVNDGDYGSRMILVDDKQASVAVDDAPPYDTINHNLNGNAPRGGIYTITNYAANITRNIDKPPTGLTTEKDLEKKLDDEDETATGRDTWGKEIEFLLSCIAMSVGLGNVWRFPFIALDNGGGAFVIPYIIVLIIVGKPIYYLEMLIGQFSSRGSAKVYDLCPALRGGGVGQVFAITVVTTYYTFLMALTLKYMIDSFNTTLPWSVCQPEWGPCVDSTVGNISNLINKTTGRLMVKTSPKDLQYIFDLRKI